MAETISRAESRPTAEFTALMSEVLAWYCQEWSVLNWLWRTVVADGAGYSDPRLRGLSLLRGAGEKEEEVFGEFLDLLRSEHAGLHLDVMATLDRTTDAASDPDLDLPNRLFETVVFTNNTRAFQGRTS